MKPHYRDLLKTAIDYKRDGYVRLLLKYGAVYEKVLEGHPQQKIVRYNDPERNIPDEQCYISTLVLQQRQSFSGPQPVVPPENEGAAVIVESSANTAMTIPQAQPHQHNN